MNRDELLKSQNLYHSVDKIYKQVLSESASINQRDYLISPHHQDLREKWIAVGYATVIERLTNRKLYLNFPAKGQDPPDFSVATLQKVDGKHEVAHIEITEADSFSFKNENLTPEEIVVSRITSKSNAAKKGMWPASWQLCVYCNFTARMTSAPIRKELEKIQPPFGQIWLLGANNNQISKIFLWEIWPGEQYQSVDLST